MNIDTNPVADLIAQRFAKAYKRLGYDRLSALDGSQFVASRKQLAQMEKF